MENFWTSTRTINGLRHFVLVNETREKGKAQKNKNKAAKN